MRLQLPSQEYLCSVLSYDPDSGDLIWKYCAERRPQWNAIWPGKIAGHEAFNAIKIHIGGKLLRAHRIIWKMLYNSEPEIIDHIDGNPLNNRLSNLRIATALENSRNRCGIGKSGLKGVSKHKASGLWRARIRAGNKSACHYFDTPEEAAACYARMADSFHDEFASTRHQRNI